MTVLLARILTLLALLQAVAGVRLILRLLRTAGGRPVPIVIEPIETARISVIVPVLNEAGRLEPCLNSLSRVPEIAETLVVDGGSVDGTPSLVRHVAAVDKRIRFIDAAPVPPDWNGKAWGLHVGARQAAPENEWLLTVDADVRVRPELVRSMLGYQRTHNLAALSLATEQTVGGAAAGLVHPALLTTLVYRFGIPGHIARDPLEAQANGQCFLIEHAALQKAGAFVGVRDSICEDVTLARALVAAGERVGFAESSGLARTEMYVSARDAWANWPRSLTLRDRFSRRRVPLDLAAVLLTQGLPLVLSAALAASGRGATFAARVNTALLAVRIGVLAGTARAYPGRPLTYWLSPLADLPVALRLWQSYFQRRHTWRGRPLVTGEPS